MGDIRPAPDRVPAGLTDPARLDPPASAAGPGRRRARVSGDAERVDGAGESGHTPAAVDGSGSAPFGGTVTPGGGRRGHRSASPAIAAIEAAPPDLLDATGTHPMRAIGGLRNHRGGPVAELEVGTAWPKPKPDSESDFRSEHRPDRQDVTETTLMRAIGAIAAVRGRRGPRTPDPETDSAWVDRQDAAETRLLRAIDALSEPDQLGRRGPEAAADRPAAAARPRTRFTSAGVVAAVILAVQAAVAISSYSGFSATYPASDIVADGHRILHSLWHGGGHPDFAGTMAGSPVVSPLLIAVVDHFGGARLVGLMIALATTSATLAAYLAARLLQGPAVGVIAAGVFASPLMLRPDTVNSCFEPLAVCAMAWAAYCGIRFAHSGTRNMLPLGAALMVLADYADYSAFWWDLAIVASLLLVRPDHDGWHHTRAWSAQRFVLVAAVLLTVCLLAGRAPYFHAITAGIVPSDGSALALSAWFAGLGLARLAVGPDDRTRRRATDRTADRSPRQTRRRAERENPRRPRRSSPSPSASPGS